MELTDTIDQVVNLTKDEKLSIDKYFVMFIGVFPINNGGLTLHETSVNPRIA